MLELSLREALSLGHNYIGTEHILLGLVCENEGVASRILLDLDADAEKIRNEIVRMLTGPGRRAPMPSSLELEPLAADVDGDEAFATEDGTTWLLQPPERVPLGALVAGSLLFGTALAVGVLVGWLIWG